MRSVLNRQTDAGNLVRTTAALILSKAACYLFAALGARAPFLRAAQRAFMAAARRARPAGVRPFRFAGLAAPETGAGFAPPLAFAQRSRCAAAILARASGDRIRFPPRPRRATDATAAGAGETAALPPMS